MRGSLKRSDVGHAKFLHGIIRSDCDSLYGRKREAFEALLAENGCALDSFAHDIFEDRCFAGSRVPKARLILELLNDRLSPDSWRLIRDRLRNQPFLTDRRHTEEYAFDVALGWLEEEFLIRQVSALLPSDARIERVGIDGAREFLSLNIRATADLSIQSSFRRLLVDVFVDHKGTWRLNGGMDLKQGKLRHFAAGKLDYVLGLDLIARRFHLIDAAKVVGIRTFANAAMGGTATARVPLGRPMTISTLGGLLAKALRKPRSSRRSTT